MVRYSCVIGFSASSGHVYRTTFNYLQGENNESMDSVSSDSAADNLISPSYSPSQQRQPQSSSAGMAPATSQVGETTPSQPANDSNLSSRIDDDGNVEFDCD